ncbi:dabb-domain-containing protein [Hypoxylon crocopeplum]|nr:dabb-domain-containing protein [Hypoxylon crocopeplum]
MKFPGIFSQMFNIRARGPFIVSVIVFTCLFRYLDPASLLHFSLPHSRMAVKHLVLFQFKADATVAAVEEATSRMLGLKNGCIHPTSQKKYIKAITGGKDNSIEGINNGITHAFVVEFESVEDRDYYVNTDPSHQVFKALIADRVEKVIVVDFIEGVF